MSTVDELRSDHAMLRRTVGRLKDALLDSETSDVVEREFRTLAGLLSKHLEREETACIGHVSQIQAVRRQEMPQDYATPDIVLRDLEALFAAWRISPREPVVVHLCWLLDELRERLDEEERDVFPALQGVDAEVYAG